MKILRNLTRLDLIIISNIKKEIRIRFRDDKYLWLLYLLRNKNYWKIIIEKKRKEKNSNYINHKNISEVLYISLLFYQKDVEIEIHIFIWIFYIKISLLKIFLNFLFKFP